MSKILIAGAPKSGTTALYYRVKQSLPDNVKDSFEPDDLNKNHNYKDLIVKSVLIRDLDLESLKKFDKRILIVRDPRDMLISALLYHGAFHSKISSTNLNKCLNLLEKKEQDPHSISVKNLWDYIIDESLMMEEFIYRLERSIDFSNYLECNIVKYEDFIANNVNSVESYLNLKLDQKFKVPRELKRVSRSKSTENWRNWFCPEDIDHFRSMFEDYMDYFKYDREDWNLNSKPVIKTEHCSEYFINTVSERKRSESKKIKNESLVFSKLKSIISRKK